MSAKRILEKYAEQRDTLPAAIGSALKNQKSSKDLTTIQNATVWQNKRLPFMVMEVE